MSNLVDHARRELELAGEEPETIEGLLKVVQAFADMNHSGASAYFCIGTLSELLSFKNLTPLTDDPDEWIAHEDGPGKKMYQNTRNFSAFSSDGGKTYIFTGKAGTHISEHKEK